MKEMKQRKNVGKRFGEKQVIRDAIQHRTKVRHDCFPGCQDWTSTVSTKTHHSLCCTDREHTM